MNPNLGVDGCGDVADDEFSFVTQTDRILNTVLTSNRSILTPVTRTCRMLQSNRNLEKTTSLYGQDQTVLSATDILKLNQNHTETE